MANIDPPTYLSITNVLVLKTFIIAILGYHASAKDFQFSLSLLVTGEKNVQFLTDVIFVTTGSTVGSVFDKTLCKHKLISIQKCPNY